ncbi:hypothetical protein F5Y16DRAFT_358462 [Xylariaceae sp. FL0255]|nr:hypothetical protein F5Y16DRAFT_358462 [Xylariaceae sp. FL0255]
MDYGKLRATALRDGEDEEAVTVDTRALIDKVLARYSGEWTTLRELIQNAADAQATTVKIKWETLPSTQVPLPSTTDRSELLKHIISYHTLRRLVVQNNGQPFAQTDWARLKRIAEGNPDETKIGAFGVGFYSVFADCEEPFVSSGNEAMAFYWKGNALFTRKVQLPQDQQSPETTFVLDYRNATTTIPNLLSVSQFLATSLTFVALQNIEFWIDDYKVLSLQKKASPSANIPISKEIETTTKERIMKVQSVERSSAQIDASFMRAVGWKPQVVVSKNETYGLATAEVPSLRSFFSRLTATSSKVTKVAKEEIAAQELISEDITALSTSSIFLRVTTAAIRPSISTNFAAELERATKKPPPKLAKLAILTSSYDETQASASSQKSGSVATATDVFASVLPTKRGGRIFIGFPTTQTTGAGMHISAPSVIPTVEREAIDLNARWIRTWNLEMLRAAGIMTRLAFAQEMLELQSKLQRAADKAGTQITAKETAAFMPEALHILKAFSFGDSTPSPHVSGIIEEAFWTCYKQPYVEIYSSRGVLPTHKVRLPSQELSKFVSGIAVVPAELEDTGFIRKLVDFDLLSKITIDDVRQELSGKPLNESQLTDFIQWAAKKAVNGELGSTSRDQLLDVAIAIVNGGADQAQGDIIALGSIRNFLTSQRIPPGLPIPPNTVPFEYTKSCSVTELRALGWELLDLAPWVRFLIESRSSRDSSQDMTKSLEFASRVLSVLSKGWENLSQSSKQDIITVLQSYTVMPTKLGMKKPGESFFPSVKLFDDLPTVDFGGNVQMKEKFLSTLGVRKTVDLETIFKRLLTPSSSEKDGAGQAKWSHVELIKYLASVRNDIPATDMKKLKESKICPSEAGPIGKEASAASSQLYKVSDLYEPNKILRPLQVKILQWPGGSLSRLSAEGRFLVDLGLQAKPSADELVEMMSCPDKTLRDNSMTYFVTYYNTNGYHSFNIGANTKAFLPLEGDPKKLVPPSGCFTNESASILGFSILKREFHSDASKFGVARDPPIQECVERLLRSPPDSHQNAILVFKYFSSRLNDLTSAATQRLGGSPIVPVTQRSRVSEPGTSRTAPRSGPVVHISPRSCYLGSASMYEEVFDFVDFGQPANAFLSALGSKNEPTKLEIAQLAAGEPARLLSTLQSPDKYLTLLKFLAGDMAILRRDRELWKKMQKAPFLLAFRELTPKSAEKSRVVEYEDDEETVKQYRLAAPSEIVILDDYISYRLFKDHLLCAPEEDVLESFYEALGVPTLSSTVTEDLKVGPVDQNQGAALWLRKHVLERSKLFMHEYARYTQDPLKHDARWLEHNLTIQIVQSVALRRSLRKSVQSHTEKRTAASTKMKNGWVLYVSSESRRPDMYQVGQAVCQLVLTRPSQQAYFFFEPFLKLDLLDLRARGYNVDRILRARQTQARIAEEERLRALDAEQAQIRAREEEFSRQTAAAAREENRTPPPTRMPGSFNSPEEHETAYSPPPAQQSRKGRGIFSNISRKFGFDSSEDAEEKLKNFLSSTPDPVAPPAESSSSGGEKPGKNEKDGQVTNPAVVQQNLLNAIKSTRAHDSSVLFSPPKTREVKEQATYCDHNAGQNIALVADASNGMRVFVSTTLPQSQKDTFLTTNHSAINTFAALLKDVGEVYRMPTSVLHIFYDEGGSTIAFNRDGSIFCNLRFYKQLHAGQKGSEDKAAAAVWWWVVLAHELAHNIIQPHNADHSYYTESFIQQYFPKMMLKASQIVSKNTSPPTGLQPASLPHRSNTSATSTSEAPPPYPQNLLD